MCVSNTEKPKGTASTIRRVKIRPSDSQTVAAVGSGSEAFPLYFTSTSTRLFPFRTLPERTDCRKCINPFVNSSNHSRQTTSFSVILAAPQTCVESGSLAALERRFIGNEFSLYDDSSLRNASNFRLARVLELIGSFERFRDEVSREPSPETAPRKKWRQNLVGLSHTANA